MSHLRDFTEVTVANEGRNEGAGAAGVLPCGPGELILGQGTISDFIPSALKYPSFTRHFCRRTLSSNSAKARVIVSWSGRAFSRSSARPVPRGSFANSTTFPQSAGGIMLTTADDFSIFLYGQKAHPM